MGGASADLIKNLNEADLSITETAPSNLQALQGRQKYFFLVKHYFENTNIIAAQKLLEREQ